MVEYSMYQSNSSSQGYASSSSSSVSYGADIVIQGPRKGRCPTNGRCMVCTRLCMMD